MRDIVTTIRGNATRSPEQRTNKDGSTGASVRMAVNPSYYDRNANSYADRKPEFVNVYCHRRLAEHVLSSVRKGEPLIASGRLSLSEWTHDDGTAGHSLSLQADAIGHDLTFGSTSYTKAVRHTEAPDPDPLTGYSDGDGAGDSDADDTDVGDPDAGDPGPGVSVDADGVLHDAESGEELSADSTDRESELAGSGPPF